MTFQEQFDKWVSFQTKDEIMHAELESVKKDASKIEELFSSKLEFGTAGIRGIMGAGTGKMNVHVVATAAYAYGKYLLELGDNKEELKNGVVIGHDNRQNSELFTIVTANVLRNLGINAHIFKGNEMQPTPLVSYTVRKLKMAGAVIITASHNPKEYNGFKVYNKRGSQVLVEGTNRISEIQKTLDPFEIDRTEKKLSYIKDTVIESYITEVLGVRLRQYDTKKLKVVFSPLSGATNKLAPKLLSQMGIDYKMVESQSGIDPTFSNVSSSNPEEGKAFDKALKLARKENADIVFATDPDGDRIGLVVKHERRWKYISGNDIASVYLNYKLKELKYKNQIKGDAYVATTVVSSDLPRKIASHYGVKVIETHVGYKNIANLIEENKDSQYIFGFEESFGSLIDPNIVRDKDGLQALVAYAEMANYYKTQGKNIYQVLKELWKTHNPHRAIQVSKKVNEDELNTLLSNLLSLNDINGIKVVKTEDFRNASGVNGLPPAQLVRIMLANGSWLAVRPSGTEPKVKIYIETTESTKSMKEILICEKEIITAVNTASEIIAVKKFNKNTVFKYSAFLSIIIAILALVFMYVYESTPTSDTIFDDVFRVFRDQNAWIWMLITAGWVWGILYKTFRQWRIYRKQKYKINFFHVMIAAMMTSFIAYVTPLTIGGDAIAYWYLRRRGVPRGAVLATIAVNTVYYQFSLVFQTIFLLSFAIPIYQDIFNSSDPNKVAAMWLFIIGLGWNLFSTFMILWLTLGSRFQAFIVRNTIKLLEWLPFIKIYDPYKAQRGSIYELHSMRLGIKTVVGDWKFVLELAMYMGIAAFVNFGAITKLLTGYIRTDLPVNGYLTQIVLADINSTANSFAITPGGSGISEWLARVVNEYMYKPGAENVIGGVEMKPQVMASVFDVLWKVSITWPNLIISGSIILTVLVGESRIEKYKAVQYAQKYGKGDKRTFTRYYKMAIAAWVVIIILWQIFNFFVLFNG